MKKKNSKSAGSRKRKRSPMAETKIEVIEVDDYSPSPDVKTTPLRPIFCLKNRDEINKFEANEECFILDFDPNEELNISNLSFKKGSDDAEEDLCVVAEKGQVACRDYPHSRNSCAKFPFEKTSHESYCKMCYCYICDVGAPCKNWSGTSGHCHAFNNEAWNVEKKARKLSHVKN